MTDRVQREGAAVRRPASFWSPAVHGLLRYLETTDFPAPRVLGTDGDTELLSWIDGESGPDGWAKIVPEAGLRRWASFLKLYHTAVAGYRPAPGSGWSSGPPRLFRHRPRPDRLDRVPPALTGEPRLLP